MRAQEEISEERILNLKNRLFYKKTVLIMKFRFYKSKLFIIIAIVLLLIVAGLFYVFALPLLLPKPTAPIALDDKYVRVCGDNEKKCHQVNLPYQDSSLSIDARVDDLINRMTIAEKIGQLILVEKNSIKDFNDVAKYGMGIVISGGGGNPTDNTPSGWLTMVNNFQSYSQKTRLAIPLLYGTDANHGHSNIPGATIFPHFIGLGASHNPDLVRKIARATAEEVAATGIYWIFSPDLDVPQDMRWGRVYETFGSDPKVVGTLGQAYIEGLQSFTQNNLTMAGTAKHYVGSGSTKWGTSVNKDYSIDQGSSNISDDEMRQIHLAPFTPAVKAGVKIVMLGLHTWNGQRISENKYLLTDVLRTELGFQGFVVSDWYGVYENYDVLVKTINAGMDVAMLPFNYRFFSDSMNKALANGDISLARLDEAVRRVLKVKFEIGLFDNTTADSSHFNNIGSQAHRDLAQQAVRESLVLLKNNNVVPISKDTLKIFVAGSSADNIGRQSGGWTIEWQGIDGNWIPGTTILKGIRDLASSNAKVEYDLDGKFTNQQAMADIGIAVVGEKPYAEGVGDNPNPSLSAEDLKTISNLKKVSKKIIVIIISGRPLDIKKYAKDWDAIIAAWLPGSEGQGIADVLFGDYPFTGTLTVDWKL